MTDKIKPARPRGVDSARVIQVIVTEGLVGTGAPDDPCHSQIRYWTLDGRLIATEGERERRLDAEAAKDRCGSLSGLGPEWDIEVKEC